MSPYRFSHVAVLGLSVALAFAVTPASVAQPFPAAGDDTTTSLGQFTVNLVPAVQALFGSSSITSPILYDPSTMIARSNPIVGGQGAVLTGGVPVGSPSIGNVAYSNLTVVPGGFTTTACASNCPDQVMTQISSFNLTGSGFTVAAGTAGQNLLNTAGIPLTLPQSYGEVQSNTGTGGGAANDFPAKSFFDVFVDIDVPVPSGGDLILSNEPLTGSGTPLLVQSTNLEGFPPRVVYVHGGSSNNPTVYLDGETGTTAFSALIGDALGTVSLAGHGIGYTNTPADMAQFQNDFAAEEAVIAPEPASLSLFGVALAGFGLMRRRRRIK